MDLTQGTPSLSSQIRQQLPSHDTLTMVIYQTNLIISNISFYKMKEKNLCDFLENFSEISKIALGVKDSLKFLLFTKFRSDL